jgi:methionine synthase II (cobalamin-independent)
VWFEPAEAGIIDRLVRIGNRVPADVELGFHLCYGDAGHQHFTQPTDAAVLVRVANALIDGLDRPLNWLHLPVPRERDDEAYYAPLADLRVGDETELYLGLVHRTDGMEGTQRRIAAASKVVPAFGISTECGLGRRPSETVPELLELHAAVARG